MTHTYNITGLTCNGCVAKAKSELLKLRDITAADVQLQSPQATLSMQKHISLSTLQYALLKAGSYNITEADGGMHQATATNEETPSWLNTYKPILLIFGYLLVVSLTVANSHERFDIETAMRTFMAGFFLTFSFFKLLNLSAFADSYSIYDIVAKRFRSWALHTRLLSCC